MNTVSVPTPVTIFSQRVQCYLDELKNAIAGAMMTAPVTGLDKKHIKLEFDVKVSPKCWSFFQTNGHSLLYLNGWEIDEFEQIENNTINLGLTGNYESSYR